MRVSTWSSSSSMRDRMPVTRSASRFCPTTSSSSAGRSTCAAHTSALGGRAPCCEKSSCGAERARQRTRTEPFWKTMDTEPRLPSSRFRRLISSRTSSMNAARSLLTPLLLASTASALRGARARVSLSRVPAQIGQEMHGKACLHIHQGLWLQALAQKCPCSPQTSLAAKLACAKTQ